MAVNYNKYLAFSIWTEGKGIETQIVMLVMERVRAIAAETIKVAIEKRLRADTSRRQSESVVDHQNQG